MDWLLSWEAAHKPDLSMQQQHLSTAVSHATSETSPSFLYDDHKKDAAATDKNSFFIFVGNFLFFFYIIKFNVLKFIKPCVDFFLYKFASVHFQTMQPY